MSRVFVTAALMLSMLAAMLTPAALTAAQSPGISVSVYVFGDGMYEIPNGREYCRSDFNDGYASRVSVLDDDGDRIKSFGLRHGEASADGFCRFDFSFTDNGSSEYTFEITGVLSETFDRDDLATGGWAVQITVTGADGEALSTDVRTGETFDPSASPVAEQQDEEETADASLAPGPIEGTDTYRIVGSFVLFGERNDDFRVRSTGCVGLGGYDDIHPGTQFKISNESGEVIGVATLEPDPDASSRSCAFIFVTEVPDAKFYTFTLGRRGDLTYSKAEMEEMGWMPGFSLN